MRKIVVYAHVLKDGIRETGRVIEQDRNFFPEIECCLIGRACVWSVDPGDLESGRRYAEKEGGQCFLLDDTDDVLEVARRKVLAMETE